MMSRKKMMLCAVVLGLAGVMGCGEKPEELHVAIVDGYCANSAQINLSKAQDYIADACKNYGSVSVIVADGKPFQSAKIDIPDQSQKGLSESKKETVIDTQTRQIVALLKESKAKNEEVDLLTSLDMGARALNSAGDGKKELLVLHSGLSTKGALNFAKGGYLGSMEADAVLEYLREQQAIPNLKGIHVTWAGLSDTIAPQPQLSGKDRSYLQEVWSRILEEAGAKVDFVEDLPTESQPDQTLPKVSIVEVFQPASAIAEIVSEEIHVEETTFILDEETVNFKPGSEELLSDEAEVEDILHELITYLSGHPSYQVLLAGTTASAGEQSELVFLSERRCSSIKDIFLRAGVREEQIQIVGLGYQNHPYYILDVDEDGQLIEPIARKNRSVIIMPLNSKAAQTLISKN